MFQCIRCNFTTTHRPNFDRHLNTSKHKKNNPVIQETPNNHPTANQKEYSCKYCGQEFVFKQSMYRHIKYRCPKNKDEDMKELVRLMNLQLEQTHKQIETQNKQIETQNKKIQQLSDKLQMQGSFNGSFNNTVNINNFILPYRDTDISHLTDKDYISSIKQVNFRVKHLIEKVHFNPEKPENMNIYISNMKDKYMMIYDNKWELKNKTELNTIYEDKDSMIDLWYENEKENHPELKKLVERYYKNIENKEELDFIKDEIKLMLYNKKDMIQEHKKDLIE
jgi:hypothetical protein